MDSPHRALAPNGSSLGATRSQRQPQAAREGLRRFSPSSYMRTSASRLLGQHDADPVPRKCPTRASEPASTKSTRLPASALLNPTNRACRARASHRLAEPPVVPRRRREERILPPLSQLSPCPITNKQGRSAVPCGFPPAGSGCRAHGRGFLRIRRRKFVLCQPLVWKRGRPGASMPSPHSTHVKVRREAPLRYRAPCDARVETTGSVDPT
jgi:hypothetical protein